MSYDVLIIGGGAAGLMAAGTAAKRGLKTAVLERNERCARKVMITGKGRCNVTNNCTAAQVIENIPVNGKFLYSALNNFAPQDTIDFFEGMGVPLKTERGRRVFPQSDKAVDIVDALVKFAHKSGAVMLNGRAKSLLLDENGALSGVVCEDKRVINARNVIVCTGGVSYPGTGSTGDGYTLARQVGHIITDIKPSLVPLVSNDPCCKQMQGLSLKNVTVKVQDNNKNKIIFDELGEMLFTHFGLSGPLILSASSYMRNMQAGRYSVLIDFKPALSLEQLDARVCRDFDKYRNKNLSNALRDLLPQSSIDVIINKSGLNGETVINQFTKQMRISLIQTIKRLEIKIDAFRPVNEAIITSGGVSVKQINPKTMQSKLMPGLYFAGEVLDVDAFTGGYNLQIAFSTGVLAGQSVE